MLSSIFSVQGSGKTPYKVTINYGTGHWCTCRGMISKKKTYGEDAGFTAGTSCKHITQIIDQNMGGDWGIRVKPGSRARKRTSLVVPSPGPLGRRAAIEATKAKRASQSKDSEFSEGSLLDRIASLEASRLD